MHWVDAELSLKRLPDFGTLGHEDLRLGREREPGELRFMSIPRVLDLRLTSFPISICWPGINFKNDRPR